MPSNLALGPITITASVVSYCICWKRKWLDRCFPCTSACTTPVSAHFLVLLCDSLVLCGGCRVLAWRLKTATHPLPHFWLQDTTPPVISSVTLNSGVSTNVDVNPAPGALVSMCRCAREIQCKIRSLTVLLACPTTSSVAARLAAARIQAHRQEPAARASCTKGIIT